MKTPVCQDDETQAGSQLQPGAEPEKEEKTKRSGSRFGKKFQMTFPKKLGRTSTETKPAAEEKAEESDKSSEKEKVYDDNFGGVGDKMRSDYERYQTAHPSQPLQTLITPSQENETPTLNIPANTAIIIQEDSPESAVAADIYRGTVGTVGQDVDELGKVAPKWLADLLLRVKIYLPF
jgi:WD repeat-containing protein 48